jgi:predicted porin
LAAQNNSASTNERGTLDVAITYDAACNAAMQSLAAACNWKDASGVAGETVTGSAYQVGGGVNYVLSKRMSLRVF